MGEISAASSEQSAASATQVDEAVTQIQLSRSSGFVEEMAADMSLEAGTQAGERKHRRGSSLKLACRTS